MDSHHLHHVHLRKKAARQLEQYPSEKTLIKWLDTILLAVAVIGPLVTIPQVVQIFRTRDVANLSPITWGLYCVFNILWIVYGFVHKERPIIITYILWFFANGIIFASIFIFS
jgi:uncharacterized protein with PQ loop repeat